MKRRSANSIAPFLVALLIGAVAVALAAAAAAVSARGVAIVVTRQSWS